MIATAKTLLSKLSMTLSPNGLSVIQKRKMNRQLTDCHWRQHLHTCSITHRVIRLQFCKSNNPNYFVLCCIYKSRQLFHHANSLDQQFLTSVGGRSGFSLDSLKLNSMSFCGFAFASLIAAHPEDPKESSPITDRDLLRLRGCKHQWVRQWRR